MNISITIGELIRGGAEVDIYNDITDDKASTFCGPIEITPECEEEFEDVLGISGTLHEHYDMYVVDLDEVSNWDVAWDRVVEFFACLSGACSEELWDRWFVECVV